MEILRFCQHKMLNVALVKNWVIIHVSLTELYYNCLYSLECSLAYTVTLFSHNEILDISCSKYWNSSKEFEFFESKCEFYVFIFYIPGLLSSFCKLNSYFSLYRWYVENQVYLVVLLHHHQVDFKDFWKLCLTAWDFKTTYFTT